MKKQGMGASRICPRCKLHIPNCYFSRCKSSMPGTSRVCPGCKWICLRPNSHGQAEGLWDQFDCVDVGEMVMCYSEHPRSLQILQPHELGRGGKNYWVLKVGSKPGKPFANGSESFGSTTNSIERREHLCWGRKVRCKSYMRDFHFALQTASFQWKEG